MQLATALVLHDDLVLTLQLLGRKLIHMERNSFAWVDIQRFAFVAPASVEDVLEALIAHEQYGDDYAGGEVGREKGVHGPYELMDIRRGSFEVTSGAEATRVIAAWADLVNGVEGREDPSEVGQLLDAEVFPLLAAGDVVRLRGAAEHDWGWVVGMHGFHEFVVIDAESGTAHLIVASDD